MSDPASLVQDVLDFQESFNRSYILVPQRNVEPGRFEPLMQPFRWWQPDHKFKGLEQILRASIVPIGQLVQAAMGTAPKHELETLLGVLEFLNQYQGGAIAALPHEDPLDPLFSTAKSVLEGWPEDGLPDPPAELQAFAEGWKGILDEAVLAADAHTIVTALRDAAGALRQTKQTTYNVVRTCGDKHLEFLEAELPGLLPADQVFFLHGLDAFANNEHVSACLRRIAAGTRYDHVRDKANEYADRVESGQETTGFEG